MAKGTVNKVIILGRLGQDPDIRATATGNQVANLSVATNEMGPKNDQGYREDKTEWHRCVLFGKTAEVAGQYLKKGSMVYLEGRLQTRKWQDSDGNDRYSTEVVCFEMQMVGSKGDQQNQSGQDPAPINTGVTPAQAQGNFNQQSQSGFHKPPGQGGQAPAPGGMDDFDEDIPF